jgi:hypothetical protein
MWRRIRFQTSLLRSALHNSASIDSGGLGFPVQGLDKQFVAAPWSRRGEDRTPAGGSPHGEIEATVEESWAEEERR